MNTEQQELTDRTSVETPDIHALLRRVLAAVEKDRRRGGLELALAIILSLATLSSTWCGYQAKSWGDIGSAKQAGADTAERKAAEDTIVGLQLRSFDGMVVLAYWDALRQQDAQARDAIFAHMRPQLRTALEAALAAGVLKDPAAAGPLQRPEYVLAEEQDAKRLREDASQLNAAAKIAGRASGSYVLLTLMFASVLFFGGITGTFTKRAVRLGLAGVAVVIFLATAAMLLRLPVYRG